MTSRTSGRGRTAATARTQPAVPRPAQQSQEKNQVNIQDQDEGEGFVLFQPFELCVSFTFKRNSSICFVLLYRFGYDGEQWLGGVGSVLSGHPPAAD